MASLDSEQKGWIAKRVEPLRCEAPSRGRVQNKYGHFEGPTTLGPTSELTILTNYLSKLDDRVAKLNSDMCKVFDLLLSEEQKAKLRKERVDFLEMEVKEEKEHA